MKKLNLFLTAIAFFSISVTALSQSSSDAFITIGGEVLKPLKLAVKDLDKFPSTEIKAKDKEGKEHTYKGTLLFAVLDSAGVTLGKQLRGENLTKYILVTATDGYQVLYSLPEIDPEFTSNTILLTTQVDGNPLPKGEVPSG
jgi:hypothetical protein